MIVDLPIISKEDLPINLEEFRLDCGWVKDKYLVWVHYNEQVIDDEGNELYLYDKKESNFWLNLLNVIKSKETFESYDEVYAHIEIKTPNTCNNPYDDYIKFLNSGDERDFYLIHKEKTIEGNIV